MSLHHGYLEVWELLDRNALRGVFADGECLVYFPFWSQVASMVSFRDADLRFASFKDSEVVLGFFERADLSEIRAERTTFRNVIFDGAAMEGAAFVGCTFIGCSFRKPRGKWYLLQSSAQDTVFEGASVFEQQVDSKDRFNLST